MMLLLRPAVRGTGGWSSRGATLVRRSAAESWHRVGTPLCALPAYRDTRGPLRPHGGARTDGSAGWARTDDTADSARPTDGRAGRSTASSDRGTVVADPAAGRRGVHVVAG
jgi:hypothetical protein